MKWERIPTMFLKSYKKNPSQPLKELETILRGMENALENCPQFPLALVNSQLKHDLSRVEEHILNRAKNIALENTVDSVETSSKFPQTLHPSAPANLKDLPSLFFLFCLKLLHTKPRPDSSMNLEAKEAPKEQESFFSKLWKNRPVVINKKRLMPALKCSLSLGFAVFFGLIYSKENGFWSGLPVAISIAAAREATFKVANIKAQGTVLGTVYGVIGCFVFESYVKIRFVSLLPWFIISSFLRQSKMYGQAGGVSAVIGALLILGRKNFGAPSDFAIARIVETFIGLSCSIMVDILLQPTRASVLAKLQLSLSLRSMHETLGAMSLESSSRFGFEERLKEMRFHVSELGKFIEEAEVEPSFWFLPFHGTCFGKLKASLSKTVDFLHFGSHALRFLDQETEKIEGKMWKEAKSKLESDLKVFKDGVSCGVKCFEEVILVNSIAGLEKEYEKRKGSVDLEMGKSGNSYPVQLSGKDDDGTKKVATSSFLGHVDELVGEGEVKGEVMLSLGALVYCMEGVVKESIEIEKGIREAVQWENPSTQVDLHNILCKLSAVKKSVTI